MAIEIVTPKRAESRILWLPFLLIAISVMMAIGEIIYWIYSYSFIGNTGLPTIPREIDYLFSILNALMIPLFVVGVACLLLFLTKAKKGIAKRGVLIFYFGTLIVILSGLIELAYTTMFFYNMVDSVDYYRSLQQLWAVAQIVSLTGLAICMIAVMLLVRSYLKREINIDPREPYGL
jgi:hypothetical protein